MRFSLNNGIDKTVNDCFFLDSSNLRVKKIIDKAFNGVKLHRNQMVDGKLKPVTKQLPCNVSREWLRYTLEAFAYKVGLEYSQVVKLLKEGGGSGDYRKMVERRAAKFTMEAAKKNRGLTSYEKNVASIAQMDVHHQAEFVRTAWMESSLSFTESERENQAKAMPIETKNKGMVINSAYA